MNKVARTLLSLGLLLSVVSASTSLENAKPDEVQSGADDPKAAFLMSISMICVSEIGDKTFLIAALMAMRHERLLVFSASTASLVIMTVLGGVIGRTFTTLIPKTLTTFLAGILFLIFGYKLILEGLEMPRNAGIEDELAEVEDELAVQDINHSLHAAEDGSSKEVVTKYVSNNKINDMIIKFMRISTKFVSPTWVQIFIMVFLGEFGDRSQISTIAMASGSNFVYVMVGASIGHALCSALAVIGGKLLATKISMRTVTLGGAFSFFVFGFVYIYEAFHS
ncbi:UPF0016 membrane protein YBR187W [Kluyveromyces marxianus]|uniref:GDT1 family protein n=2 Tax=Kluyveromyces marxianus TaxID=4911 RepID=W0T6I2_KLUMD|nr:uncharacterized protein KLMA_10774 [Kluyveromyces marxianus DMKU3-1042]QGN13427.1 UPF0016 membrane protein YBR187W [Kluyveromyces marxianus]BAO38396.1 UPF0016 membrane protein YBR187W [Kluyveromyces marxianus DMKU3-1042]BAP69953.1 UPF0016 membrane protein YBR187W [Kluyveromyces marxianus]